MLKIRNIVSSLLLLVYLVILAHGLIPHHHHSDQINDSCHIEQIQLAKSATQSLLQQGTHECQHDNDSTVHCHFSVELVPSKVLLLVSSYLVSAIVEELVFQEQEVETYAESEVVFPKIFVDHPSGLRAPPALS